MATPRPIGMRTVLERIQAITFGRMGAQQLLQGDE
jgi:hypothetical protein